MITVTADIPSSPVSVFYQRTCKGGGCYDSIMQHCMQRNTTLNGNTSMTMSLHCEAPIKMQGSNFFKLLFQYHDL